MIPADNLNKTTKNGVSTKTTDEVELSECAVNAQDVVTIVNRQKPSATIFFLDCCREYHLRHDALVMHSQVAHNNQLPGLRAMFGSVNSLFVFSCAPGTTAPAGAKGERNSLFTKHLLNRIETPNEHILMMLTKVFNDVVIDSKSKQKPCFSGTVTSDSIYLYELPPGT